MSEVGDREADPVARWRDRLEALRIPTPILEAAPEPPWGFPTELFRRRAERSVADARDPTPTSRRAEEALPAGGSVLDVGCGAGATSLPLARRAGRLTGVDGEPDMLRAFLDAAATAGVRADVVHGPWPRAGSETGPADVVVCGHVLYNVAEIAPFVQELAAHARCRVVTELTDRHPLAWMADLWLRFHGLERPPGPTADDAVDAMRALRIEPHREERDAGDGTTGDGFERRADAVALVRRRLCLPSTRDPEIEEALGARLAEAGGLWSAGPARTTIVTLWWDVDPGLAGDRQGSSDSETRLVER